MATGEDQTEAIIFDLLVIDLFVMQGSFIDARFCIERKIFLGSVDARAPAHPIYGLEARRGNQPGARAVRNTSLRPGLQSGGECLMHGLFGEIQTFEEAHERR